MAKFHPESVFGGYTDNDSTIQFYLRVRSLLKPDSKVLDVGCGRGAGKEDPCKTKVEVRTMKGSCAKYLGIDVDPEAAENPLLDEFRLIESPTSWPVEDAWADLIVSDNVLEHVPSPDDYFREISRILKPGGYLCIRTPNSLGYVALMARLTPNSLHAKVLSKICKKTRKEKDVFPTLYRCNTVWQLRRAFAKHGLSGVVYGHECEPTYLSFSSLAYRCGLLYQRLAPSFFKTALFAFAKKVE